MGTRRAPEAESAVHASCKALECAATNHTRIIHNPFPHVTTRLFPFHTGSDLAGKHPPALVVSMPVSS
jgi:hypothetical protein